MTQPVKIIDEYLGNGFNRILLRALTPLWCANKKWSEIGYSPKEFLKFYMKAFDYILELSLKGTYVSEGIASIFLSKIIEGVAVNYMELRSPCGATVGQIAYYCKGKIHTCDEGRMIAEMGDDAFCLGTYMKAIITTLQIRFGAKEYALPVYLNHYHHVVIVSINRIVECAPRLIMCWIQIVFTGAWKIMNNYIEMQ